jgi:hypothetical protein
VSAKEWTKIREGQEGARRRGGKSISSAYWMISSVGRQLVINN